jgi:uncharacterized membrane protein
MNHGYRRGIFFPWCLLLLAGWLAAPSSVLAQGTDDASQREARAAIRVAPFTAPAIAVDPTSFEEFLFTDEIVTRTLGISNTGDEDLLFQIMVDAEAGPLEAWHSPADVSALQLRMQQNAAAQTMADARVSGARPDQTEKTGRDLLSSRSGVYTGDFLHFGISDLGEVMPFQHPVGVEHLNVGAPRSGYTLAYTSAGAPAVVYAGYESRFGVESVSYHEIVNTASQVVAEAVIHTADGKLEIVRRVTFHRDERFVRIRTDITNISGAPLESVVFKGWADWDIDGDFNDDDWDYDFERNLILGSDANYVGIASYELPTYMDIDGWNDWQVAPTIVDIPVGPVENFDGLTLLHFDVGDLADGATESFTTVFAAGSDLAQLQQAVDRGLALWLSVDPITGVVTGGSSVDVDVTFAATRLFGGDYLGDLVIESNDPAAPQTIVPAVLHVTGVPAISVFPEELVFQPLIAGITKRDTVWVSNPGTEALVVDSIWIDGPPDFAVTPSSLVVPVGQTLPVEVSLTPPTVTPVTGTLNLASDDPEHPLVQVPLTGLPPSPHLDPEIVVTPDSLDVSLWTGETATEVVTIENVGGSVLNWVLAFVPRPGSPLRGDGDGSPLAAADLTGMRILYDRSRGQVLPDPWTMLISDLEARGATVEVQWSRLTPSHLANFDVLWSTNTRGTWSAEERAAVHDWLIAGGSILLEGDTDASVLNFNALLEWLESGIHYSLWDGVVGISTDIVPHPVTAGVDSVYLAPGAHLSEVAPSSFPLVRDLDGNAIVACEEFGFGRLVVMSDEVLRIEQVDNVALGGRVFDWFAAPRWISADRLSGSVPMGSADDVQITFDAGFLFGGDYRAELVITSNDFVTPRVTVGAHMHVTGAPDVQALPDSIDFGPVFVTTSAADTIRISNVGTDTLLISDISLDGPSDFQLTHSIGDLAPGEFDFLYVTFTPSTEASFSGEVRITSNDPDEPVLSIPLAGEGLFPPEIQVTPDSLVVDAISGDIVPRTLTIANVGANQLIWSLVVETSSGGPWLSAAPVSGVVAAGTAADVTVTFDTSGLLEGDYEGSLTITSNDPATPEVVVDVLLRVTGIPNITVTPSSLDYGPVFIGAAVQDSVRVRNMGTGPLAVTAVAVEGSSDFSVSASPFVLEPFASQYVVVHFAPSVVGAITANLRLDSDDPDQPVTLVPLAGEGLVAPVIGVTPDSLDVELFVGEMATDTLTISNTGGNDLVWEITVRPPLALNARLSTGESGRMRSGKPEEPGVASRQDGSLEGVRILWPMGHNEWWSSSTWETMVNELEARGATVTESSEPLTPDLLADYDIVWSVEVQSPWVGNELHDLAAWVLNGGSMMIEGDGDVAVEQYNALFSELGAGIVMSTINGVAAQTTNIHPHPTTEGVTSIDLLGPRASLATVEWPAVRLVDDAGTTPTPNVAACSVGGGRIVIAAEQLLHPQNIGNPDNILFGNQIFDWLAALTWIRLPLWSGIVPAGSSTDVEVVFDASNTNGGNYFARLAVASNDPLTPRVDVGVHMLAIGAPDIDVTPMALDFGRVYVGGAVEESVTVANVGTDTLAVTEIAIEGSPDFGVTPATLTLAPGEGSAIVVSFAPSAAGSVTAAVRIVSNDPDESPLFVDLAGEGYLPPVIVVSPDSLEADLISGQTSVQTVTIQNAGIEQLEWEIWVRNRSRASLTGVDILWDRSRGQSSSSTWSTLIGDLEAQGATVTESTSSLSPSHLAAYDILWTINAWSSWALAEREAVRDWVLAGGALILEGDANAAVVAFNDLLTTVGVGVQYSTANGVSGITTDIEPHQMTVGVDSLDLGSVGAHLPVVTSPAGTLVRDVAGNAMVAYEEIGAGRVVAMAAKIQSNDNIGSAKNRLFGNRVFAWLVGPLWITTEPTSGTVPGGESTDVTVTMDATGLLTGTYEADLAVTSNDPVTPEVLVPVTMGVTGVQDIAVSPDSLLFGEVYVGVAVRDTVWVTNVGTETLTVTDVSVSGSTNFTASPTSFQLEPGEEEVVDVEFLPTEPISYVADLQIESDDPDEPVVDVALLGQGVTAPVIAVSPDSIGVSLYPGGEHTEPLVITNSGGSSLEWQIRLDLNAGGLPRGRLADLTGVHILWPRGHSELYTSSTYATMVGELEARGATVTESSDLLTPGLLADYDIVWSVEVQSSWIGNERHDLATWILNGGSLMVEGDGDVAVAQYNALFSELAAGIEMSTVNGAAARTTNIHPHPTTEGVTSIDLLGPRASLAAVALPAVRLVDDAGATPTPNVAAAEVGAGRIVVAAEQLLHPQNIGSADNILFGNQIFDWLAKAGWLNVEPKYGTTEAGSANSLEVAINARRVPAGDYDADIVIASNDPITPEERVPVHLHVIGAPDIGVSPPSLAFGSVFVGDSARDTIWVANEGTETLVVSSIGITGDDAFVISPSSLMVSPGQTEPAAVTFAPLLAGSYNAAAEFASNDPDEPLVVVPLSGEGLIPPVIGVTPDSLVADLFSGESEDQIFTILNGGGSDLEWSLRIEPAATEPQLAAHGLLAEEASARGASTANPSRARRDYSNLAGVKILWPRGHGELWPPSTYDDLVPALEARGATITESSDPLTPALLAEYDIVWSVEPTTTWLAGELTVVADWIRAGGSLMVEVDGDEGVAAYNELFAELLVGIEMSTVNGTYARTTNIHPHVITEGVTSVDLLGPRATLSRVEWPAFRLVDDAGGTPNVAVATIEAGRLVVAAEQVFHPQNMNNPDNLVLGNQAFDWLARRQWLETDISSGTVGSGGSQDVTVTFQSAGMVAGQYEANILIESNDPLTPQVTVPAIMRVTGAGHIEITPASLDFGILFVGLTAELDLQVSNPGTDVLNVSAITVEGEPTFAASHTSLVLLPGQSQAVTVSFAPTEVTPYTGVVHFESDDPSQPLVDVPLSGEGVLPPVVGTNPDSLGVELLSGDSTERVLAITNTGGSPLNWSLSVQHVAPLAMSLNGVSGPTSSLRADYADLTGVDILWPRGHGEGWSYYWRTLVEELEARGATVTESSEPFTTELLADYDIVWSVRMGSVLPVSEGEALANWLRLGGSLMIEGRSDGAVAAYNALLADVGAGVEMSTVDGTPGITMNILPHPTTVGVTSINLGDTPGASLSSVVAPGVRLVDDAGGTPSVAASELGIGRIVIASAEVFNYGYTTHPDNLVFGNQVFDWLAHRQWLSVDVSAGTIEAGGSQDVIVTFAADGLLAGEYVGSLVIESNDPVTPELSVPAVLHVTGVGDILVLPLSLDFGQQFVGYPSQLGIQVFNVGTDSLNVTSITWEGDAGFVVAPPTLTLGPGEMDGVIVTFVPPAPGAHSGTVHLDSDDPDEPRVDIPVVGEGIIAPVIGVTPGSLSEALAAGGQTTRELTLSNTGGSDLDWYLELEVQPPLGESAAATSPASRTSRRRAAVLPAAEEGVRGGDLRGVRGNLDGLRVMWDLSHGQNSSGYWSILIAELEARGATVTENTGWLTPEILADYDVYCSSEGHDNWTAVQLDAMFAWVTGGGRVLLEGDSDGGIACFNALLSRLGSGIECGTENATSGPTSNLTPHVTTRGVSAIHLSSPQGRLTQVSAPAFALVVDSGGIPVGAVEQIGGGRVFVITDEVFYDWYIDMEGNRRFGHQVFAWFANTAWLSVQPESGTVTAAGGDVLTVTFDATDLIGGDYQAEIVFTSNDPVTPELRVPTDLHVTGIPDIDVAPLALDFGTVFVGQTEADTVWVKNVGTDELTVAAALVAGEPHFAISPSGFSVAPFDSQAVRVTFAPQVDGQIVGTLELSSDDPDEPVVQVDLGGTGAEAPVITVSPDTVRVVLEPGASATEPLMIGNTGGSDLVFSLFVTTGDFGFVGVASTAGARVPRAAPGDAAVTARDSGESARALRGNESGVSQMPLVVSGMYTGDHLYFGITDYGEIMPFQHPVGNEHLDVLTRISGYTVSYFVGATEVTAYAATDVRSGITPVSYQTLENSSERVLVEVVTRTTEGSLKITRTFVFEKDDRFVRVETRLDNEGAADVQDVIFKSFADWDMDGDFADDTFAYDTVRNMIRANDETYAALASYEIPALMDIDGWGDYDQRETVVDITAPSVSGYDGMPILHFELGTLAPGTETGVTTAFAAGMDLEQLNEVVAGALEIWLTAEPLSGVVAPASSAEITLTMDATDLEAGEYGAIIRIASNDPLAPTTIVPVFLTVATSVGCEPGASPRVVTPDLPREFALYANAPNPFASATILRFDLPVPTAVSLRVFSVQGRLVRTIVDGQVEAGRHQRRWDGRDDRGRGVAAGVYFYRLEAKDFDRTRKMILLSRR